MQTDSTVPAIAHVISISVAPVFLLSGIGAMLAVMTNRLSRVVDRARYLEAQIDTDESFEALHLDELKSLSKRAKYVGTGITLCTATALLICALIVMLFVGAFFGFEASVPVSLLFILAMLTFFFGLLSFLREVRAATDSLRIGGRHVHKRK